MSSRYTPRLTMTNTALKLLLGEFKPPITRHHDVTEIVVTPTELKVTMIERDDHGWPVMLDGSRVPATITRRTQFEQTVMEAE